MRIIGVMLVCVLAGCAGSKVPGQLDVVPARGRVLTADGQPLPGAVVMFHPLNSEQKVKSQAPTGPDGTFSATTYRTGDGAPPGDYVLTVMANPDPGVHDSRYGPDQSEIRKGARDARSRIPQKFTDPSTSTLKVKVSKENPDLGALELK